ncbi:aldehyde ferredoxin oxidoreductase [Candidatus Geothermarchaeota archaeon]|nr:MAG: aldehyde ferredoxin oxidoreductase [Candidatus Geothermarchaeota archaeon]
MNKYRLCTIDVGKNTHILEDYRFEDGILGPIDLAINLHLNKYKSYQYDVYSPLNAIIFGKGPFTGGALIGMHRLTFIFRSPQSSTLHVSSVGGVGYRFMNSGLDAVSIVGKGRKPTILVIYSEPDCRLNIVYDSISKSELEDVFEGFNGFKGVYALTYYLLNRYGEYIRRYRLRPILIGPASIYTINGAIFSFDIGFHNLSIRPGSEDSAARGGGGSVLYNAHNVVAILVGGLCEKALFKDRKWVDELIRQLFNSSYGDIIMKTTEKYKYSSKLGTGGTFGVNYIMYRDLIPVFGYNMIYLSRFLRLRLNEYILKYFWSPFNKIVSRESRNWFTCGEPCPVTCKKVYNGKKVDYEPFNALGPYIGVFIFEDTLKLVEYADSLGFDIIELGHVIAWIFDVVKNGLLKPGEIGLSDHPRFDPLTYRPNDSHKNMELACEVIDGLIKKDNWILRMISDYGLRYTVKKLDEAYRDRVLDKNISFKDLAVYVAYGEYGYMSINFYWTPGMLAPLYILGRYWTNYHPTFMSPEEYAASSLERALMEYLIDNSGLCRFHRGWGEKVLPILYSKLLNTDIDLKKHALRMYSLIRLYSIKAGAEPRYWEGKKVKDIIATIAGEIEVEEWAKKFSEDLEEGLRGWWSRFNDYIVRTLEG